MKKKEANYNPIGFLLDAFGFLDDLHKRTMDFCKSCELRCECGGEDQCPIQTVKSVADLGFKDVLSQLPDDPQEFFSKFEVKFG